MIERMLAACLAAFAGAAAAQSAVQPATIDELEQAYQSAQSEILPELEAVPFDEATNAGIYQFKVGATVVVQPSSFLVFKASDGTLLNGDLPFAIGANEAQGLKEGKIPKDGYQFKACADATVFATPKTRTGVPATSTSSMPCVIASPDMRTMRSGG